MISAKPYAFANSAKGVDMKTGRLIPVEEKKPVQGKVVRQICPPEAGAKDWQPSAYSPRTELLYVPHQNLCQDIDGVEANYIEGTPYRAMPAVVTAEVAFGPSAWASDPAVVVALALSGLLYAVGTLRTRRRAAGALGPRIVGWQAASFAAGWLALVAALLSPLDDLASKLFSAHMVQHEILIVVAAPLCVLGRPLTVFLAALPGYWRTAAGGLTRRPGMHAARSLLTGPRAVWVLHGAALWVWHLPALYQAALANERIHALEHACFFGTALLFWWALVHGRYGRFGYGVSVLYVFTTALHSNLLGALLTMTPRVWYPAYGRSAAQWGLTPLEDQQLAGLVMWVPSGLVLTILGLALFAAWIGESERRVAYTQSERLARGGRS